MKLVIEVDTENEAFDSNPDELQRIVSDAVDLTKLRLDTGRNLYDSNGNRVGDIWIEHV